VEQKIQVSALSAGIIVYRQLATAYQVLLVHPGGPFWHNKDDGAWSIPKGEMTPDEEPEAVARREFAEELGTTAPAVLLPLGEIRQRGGKRVHAFSAEGDVDVRFAKSNTFQMEWPPKSGRLQDFPEVDRAEWFDLATARVKILASQLPLLDRLQVMLAKL
jgi:predicted NUDIX family NTP pyrophosphohydrolase